MVNGAEARVAMWSIPKYQWSLEWTALHNDVEGSSPRNLELQTMMSFFNDMAGSWDTFYFPDTFTPDYTVAAQFIANGDGTTATFPLIRTLGTSTEPVYVLNNLGSTAPNYGWLQPVVMLNGTPLLGSQWSMTVDPATVTITGGSGTGGAPGIGQTVTATFSYFWRVRLTEDSQSFVEQWPIVWATDGEIKFTSVRPQ